jgi:hypothetical protein
MQAFVVERKGSRLVEARREAQLRHPQLHRAVVERPQESGRQLGSDLLAGDAPKHIGLGVYSFALAGVQHNFGAEREVERVAADHGSWLGIAALDDGLLKGCGRLVRRGTDAALEQERLRVLRRQPAQQMLIQPVAPVGVVFVPH